MIPESILTEELNRMRERNERFRKTARLIETDRTDERGRSVGQLAVRLIRDGTYEVLTIETLTKPGAKRPHRSSVILYLSPEQVVALCQTLRRGLDVLATGVRTARSSEQPEERTMKLDHTIIERLAATTIEQMEDGGLELSTASLAFFTDDYPDQVWLDDYRNAGGFADDEQAEEVAVAVLETTRAKLRPRNVG